jgi:hypothetical protein
VPYVVAASGSRVCSVGMFRPLAEASSTMLSRSGSSLFTREACQYGLIGFQGSRQNTFLHESNVERRVRSDFLPLIGRFVTIDNWGDVHLLTIQKEMDASK